MHLLVLTVLAALWSFGVGAEQALEEESRQQSKFDKYLDAQQAPKEEPAESAPENPYLEQMKQQEAENSYSRLMRQQEAEREARVRKYTAIAKSDAEQIETEAREKGEVLVPSSDSSTTVLGALLSKYGVGSGAEFALLLVLSFVITWSIGLLPPLLIRFALYRKPLTKVAAATTVGGFWLFNLVLFISLGSQSKSHFSLILIAFASYYILRKAPTLRELAPKKARKPKEPIETVPVALPPWKTLDKVLPVISIIWMLLMAIAAIGHRGFDMPNFIGVGLLPLAVVNGLYWIIRDTDKPNASIPIYWDIARLLSGKRFYVLLAIVFVILVMIGMDIAEPSRISRREPRY